MTDCPDDDRACPIECDRKFPEGGATWARLLMCLDVRCHDTCSGQ